MTSIAGVFDVDGDGDQEIFVFDTSARSVIYNAAMLTPEGLEMTTLIRDRTIDTETSEPFNAAGFRCTAAAGRRELRSIDDHANNDSVSITITSIGLDDTSVTETVI